MYLGLETEQTDPGRTHEAKGARGLTEKPSPQYQTRAFMDDPGQVAMGHHSQEGKDMQRPGAAKEAWKLTPHQHLPWISYNPLTS